MASFYIHEAAHRKRNLTDDFHCLKKMKELAKSEKQKLELHKLEVMNELRTYESMLRDLKAGRPVHHPGHYHNSSNIRQESRTNVDDLETKVENDPDTVNKERIDIGLKTLQCLVSGEIYISDEEECEEDDDDDDKDDCLVIP